jgi:hypothetical protein
MKAVCPAFGFGALLAVFWAGRRFFLLPVGGFFSDAYRIAALHGAGDDYAAAASVLLDRLTMPLSIICVWLPIMAFTGDARYGPRSTSFSAFWRRSRSPASPRYCIPARGRRYFAFQRGIQKARRQKNIRRASKSFRRGGIHEIGPGRILLTIGLGLLGDNSQRRVPGLRERPGRVPSALKWIWVYALPLIATTPCPPWAGWASETAR